VSLNFLCDVIKIVILKCYKLLIHGIASPESCIVWVLSSRKWRSLGFSRQVRRPVVPH